MSLSTLLHRPIIFLFSGLLLLASCGKNNDSPAPVPSTCRITSIQQRNYPTTTYTYNAIGQVENVTNLYDFGNGTFSYLPGKVTFTGKSGTLDQSFNLDAAGRIISDAYDKFVYNNEGYLTTKFQETQGIIFSKYDLFYTNGNLVRVETDDDEIMEITYYENEPVQDLLGLENPISSSLIFDFRRFSPLKATFTGKGPKNMVKEITFRRENTGLPNRFANSYSYVKNPSGRIIAMTITKTGGFGAGAVTSTLNYIFNYECGGK